MPVKNQIENELSTTQIKYQRQELFIVQIKNFIADTNETFNRLTHPKFWLSAIGGLGLLSACTPPTIEATQPPSEVIVVDEPLVTKEPTQITHTPISPLEESTLTPTVAPPPTKEFTPTPTHTVENPLASIPEHFGLISHIETLDDGRTVAIAAPYNPEAAALLRVAQRNDTGEWIPYVPEILDRVTTDGAVEYLFPQGAPELINLTDVEQQTYGNSSENPDVPLGYIGRTYLDPEKEVWLDWVSGAVTAIVPASTPIIGIRLQVPTLTGDLALIDIYIIDEFQSGSNVFTLESFGSDVNGKTLVESGLDTGVDNDWIIRGSQLSEYFRKHQSDLLGQQLIFGLAGGNAEKPKNHLLVNISEANTTKLRQDLVEYLQGGEKPNLGRIKEQSIMITPLEGLILSQQTIDEINDY